MIVFADTSGLACYLIRTEPAHANTVSLFRNVCDSGGKLVTTNYVLAELAALLTRPLRIPKVQRVDFIRSIRSSDWIEIVHVDPIMDAAAWLLWETRPDKEWSLVDCASFAIMKHRSITDAVTEDVHFEQAGFVRLLK